MSTQSSPSRTARHFIAAVSEPASRSDSPYENVVSPAASGVRYRVLTSSFAAMISGIEPSLLTAGISELRRADPGDLLDDDAGRQRVGAHPAVLLGHVRGEEVAGHEGVVRLLRVAGLLVDRRGVRGDLVLGHRPDRLADRLVVLGEPVGVEVRVRHGPMLLSGMPGVPSRSLRVPATCLFRGPAGVYSALGNHHHHSSGGELTHDPDPIACPQPRRPRRRRRGRARRRSRGHRTSRRRRRTTRGPRSSAASQTRAAPLASTVTPGAPEDDIPAARTRKPSGSRVAERADAAPQALTAAVDCTGVDLLRHPDPGPHPPHLAAGDRRDVDHRDAPAPRGCREHAGVRPRGDPHELRRQDPQPAGVSRVPRSTSSSAARP